jgi:Protein kinase domain/Ankyrin repeats (3 copies)
MKDDQKQDIIQSTRDSTVQNKLQSTIGAELANTVRSLRLSEDDPSKVSWLSTGASKKHSFSSFSRSMATSGLSASFRDSIRSEILYHESYMPDFELVSKICLDRPEDTISFINQKSDEDLHVRLDKGRSILMYAVLREDISIIQAISGRVPSMVEWKDQDKRTALHHCCLRRKLVSLQCLLILGANSSCADDVGRTPLHYSAQNDSQEMMLLLLAKGADIHAIDSYGNNCLSYLPDSRMKSDLSKEFSLAVSSNKSSRKMTLLNRVALTKRSQIWKPKRSTEEIELFSKTSTRKQNWENTKKERDSQAESGWIVEDFLATGNFGNVYCGRRQGSNQLVALKEYSKRQMTVPELTKRLLSEKNACINIDSPFVIKGLDFFQTEKKLYMALEYFSNSDLGKYLQLRGPLPENQIRVLAAELVLAIESIHAANFIHRDLKPDNILITDSGHVVVADFGLSTQLGDSKFSTTSTFCGTLCYLPPEIIGKKLYAKPVDWYLLGEVLYESAFGAPPFFDPCKKRMRTLIDKCDLQFPKSHSYSAPLLNLLSQLLTKDPSLRLGTKYGAADVKKHNYFLGLEWQSVAKRRLPLFDPSSLRFNKLRELGRLIMPVSEDTEEFMTLAGWSR